MRSLVVPATLVALLVAPAAFASSTTIGSVTSIDTKTMTLILDNGIACKLP
jgi:hypothetical protein